MYGGTSFKTSSDGEAILRSTEQEALNRLYELVKTSEPTHAEYLSPVISVAMIDQHVTVVFFNYMLKYKYNVSIHHTEISNMDGMIFSGVVLGDSLQRLVSNGVLAVERYYYYRVNISSKLDVQL